MIVNFLVGFVALLHFYFMALESFFWTRPLGRKVFGSTAEYAETTRSLAANQGVYNGFLASGLVWTFFLEQPFENSVRVFFLICVVIAGFIGAVTVNKKIFLVQGLPAVFALAALTLN